MRWGKTFFEYFVSLLAGVVFALIFKKKLLFQF